LTRVVPAPLEYLYWYNHRRLHTACGSGSLNWQFERAAGWGFS
jgi:hypothetical protein